MAVQKVGSKVARMAVQKVGSTAGQMAAQMAAPKAVLTAD